MNDKGADIVARIGRLIDYAQQEEESVCRLSEEVEAVSEDCNHLAYEIKAFAVNVLKISRSPRLREQAERMLAEVQKLPGNSSEASR
jgi:hypothetical protein